METHVLFNDRLSILIWNDLMPKTKSITQEFVGLVQLSEAVNNFYNKNYICAITLAGAAEEIFGKMSEKKGASNAFGTEKFLFESFGAVDYGIGRNRVRNELKHLTDNEKVTYQDLKMYAVQLISAAIINFKLTSKKLPRKRIIVQFCKELGIS